MSRGKKQRQRKNKAGRNPNQPAMKLRQRVSIKKVLGLLFSRMVVVGVLIFLQFVLLVALLVGFRDRVMYAYPVMVVLSVAVSVWVVTGEDNPAYKISWVLVISALPVFGGLFYILFGNKRVPDDLKIRIQQFYDATIRRIEPGEGSHDRLEAEDPQLGMQARYIRNVSGFPVWDGTQGEYLPIGEAFFEALKLELMQARRFIFMEYFIVQEGRMWDPIFDILRKKAAEGVEVRFLYDDVGTLQTLPNNYRTVLEKAGIKTAIFNPFRPHLNIAMNYRDHRKITVIDGNVGFCGGINLADEYINAYEKHGHWKDTAVLLRGSGVWNLTLMFLMMWQFTTTVETDFDRYRPTQAVPNEGYVQPFGDSPLDNLNVSENAYMQIINRATRYVYITTPYLILDNEMITALSTAAQSGIDVRIITPHIADKWYVHIVTRSYYSQLIRAGVKIYEYTPGFIHAKMFTSDDKVAIVGTTNMDYRSFYLHFECGVSFYNSPVAKDVRDDFLNTLQVCQPISLEEMEQLPLSRRILAKLLRLMAPLM